MFRPDVLRNLTLVFTLLRHNRDDGQHCTDESSGHHTCPVLSPLAVFALFMPSSSPDEVSFFRLGFIRCEVFTVHTCSQSQFQKKVSFLNFIVECLASCRILYKFSVENT